MCASLYGMTFQSFGWSRSEVSMFREYQFAKKVNTSSSVLLSKFEAPYLRFVDLEF
mgnify:FL=1